MSEPSNVGGGLHVLQKEEIDLESTIAMVRAIFLLLGIITAS